MTKTITILIMLVLSGCTGNLPRIVDMDIKGIVLDQNGKPVSGVKVLYQTSHGPLLAVPYNTPKRNMFAVTTNSDGVFSAHTSGNELSILKLSKNGYIFHFNKQKAPDTFRNSTEETIVYKVWKKSESAKLAKGKMRINTDLNNKGVFVLNNLPISFEIKWLINGTYIKPEWTASLRVLNGLIVETNDIYMYEAPKKGYKKECIIDSKSKNSVFGNVSNKQNKTFYFMTNDRKYYGSAIIDFSPYSNRGPEASVRFSVNLDGARNLYSDK